MSSILRITKFFIVCKTNTSLVRLNFSFFLLSHLHPIYICGIYALSQLCHFCNDLQKELASKSPYKASIGEMKLRLQKLQAKDKQAQKARAKHSQD